MPITGFTNINVDGNSSLKGTVLTALTLASADITLTEEQCIAGRIEVTTGHAANAIIIPAAFAYPGKIYIVNNNHATLATLIKVAGGTAVTVAATKTAIVQINGAGTEVKRVTADA